MTVDPRAYWTTAFEAAAAFTKFVVETLGMPVPTNWAACRVFPRTPEKGGRTRFLGAHYMPLDDNPGPAAYGDASGFAKDYTLEKVQDSGNSKRSTATPIPVCEMFDVIVDLAPPSDIKVVGSSGKYVDYSFDKHFIGRIKNKYGVEKVSGVSPRVKKWEEAFITLLTAYFIDEIGRERTGVDAIVMGNLPYKYFIEKKFLEKAAERARESTGLPYDVKFPPKLPAVLDDKGVACDVYYLQHACQAAQFMTLDHSARWDAAMSWMMGMEITYFHQICKNRISWAEFLRKNKEKRKHGASDKSAKQKKTPVSLSWCADEHEKVLKGLQAGTKLTEIALGLPSRSLSALRNRMDTAAKGSTGHAALDAYVQTMRAEKRKRKHGASDKLKEKLRRALKSCRKAVMDAAQLEEKPLRTTFTYWMKAVKNAKKKAIDNARSRKRYHDLPPEERNKKYHGLPPEEKKAYNAARSKQFEERRQQMSLDEVKQEKAERAERERNRVQEKREAELEQMPFAKRGKWDPEEHARFLAGVEAEGVGNWSKISPYVTTKTSKQVKNHGQAFFRSDEGIQWKEEHAAAEQEAPKEA